MKRLGELTLDDLLDCGVWKLTFRAKVVEANDGWVSPVRAERIDRVDLFAVRSRFKLADGSGALGYCVPVESTGPPIEHFIGFLSPAIVTPRGRVTLWLGERVSIDGHGLVRGDDPTKEELAAAYALLENDADSVFPLSFAADVLVPEGLVASGTVEGFGYTRSTPDLPPQGYSKYGSEDVWVK